MNPEEFDLEKRIQKGLLESELIKIKYRLEEISEYPANKRNWKPEAIEWVEGKIQTIDEMVSMNDIKKWERFKRFFAPKEFCANEWDELYNKALEKASEFFRESKNRYKKDIVANLIYQGFHEEDAFIAAELYEHSLKDGKSTGIESKNRVYFITDKDGNKKVIKFNHNEKEAKVEALVNYFFSQDPLLKEFVPKSAMIKREGFEGYEPIKVDVEGKPMYITIQEDVREKKKKNYSLDTWMKVLARVHIVGTYVVNSLKKQNKIEEYKCTKSTKERDDDNILRAHLAIDWGLRKVLTDAGIEEGIDFCHGDLRFDNMAGSYILDWGGAGKGNGLKDVAQLLSDAYVKEKISDDECKRLIEIYLNEKRNTASTFGGEAFYKVTEAEVENAFNEFKGLAIIYYPKFSAYKMLKQGEGKIISEHEKKSIEAFTERQKDFEKSFIPVFNIIRYKETDNSIIYELPERASN